MFIKNLGQHAGVEIKLLYDDIGCMATLPGDYA